MYHIPLKRLPCATRVVGGIVEAMYAQGIIGYVVINQVIFKHGIYIPPEGPELMTVRACTDLL